jgi:hypothetical protein
MKGRMALFVIATLTWQLSPSYLTRASAADQTGVASVYSTESGGGTATGQKLTPETLTAAHRTLPLGRQRSWSLRARSDYRCEPSGSEGSRVLRTCAGYGHSRGYGQCR